MNANIRIHVENTEKCAFSAGGKCLLCKGECPYCGGSCACAAYVARLDGRRRVKVGKAVFPKGGKSGRRRFAEQEFGRYRVWRFCMRKKSYRDLQEVREAARKAEDREGVPMYWYECDCGDHRGRHYHLTKIPHPGQHCPRSCDAA